MAAEETDIKFKESVLVIEDDQQFCTTLTMILRKEGYEVEGVANGLQAIEMVKKKRFDLIVTDVRLPGGIDGIDVLKQIKEIYTYPVKMIIMTGYADNDAPVRAIRVGVDDYLYKPFELDEFLHSVNKNIRMFNLEKDVDYYRELSIHDGLTGLYNHRYFHEVIQREVDRANRYEHSLSLMMADVDNFKSFNDTFGHCAGDMLLRKVAYIFKKVLREVDLVFRYGGEEFTVILPETATEEALVIAERLRVIIADNEALSDETKGKAAAITISIGIATLPIHAVDKEQLIKNADSAMYAAKKLGKNRTCVYEKKDGKKDTAV